MQTTTDAYRTLLATVEGERVTLHFIQLIDVYPTDDGGNTYVEFSGVCQLTQRTAYGRLKIGDLLDEATWIWAE